MEVQGIIKVIGETKAVNDRGFQKRELVITTQEQYPQHLLIEFVQDKCSLLDGLTVGQQVKVSINLRGREWVSPQGEVKYFNSIQGWRVEVLAPAPEETTNDIPPIAPDDAFEPANELNEEDYDDLPF